MGRMEIDCELKMLSFSEMLELLFFYIPILLYKRKQSYDYTMYMYSED